MHQYRSLVVLLLLATSVPTLKVNAQKTTVSYGKTTIALNEPLAIIIAAENTELKNYSTLPEIEGFTKAGTSNTSATTITNGEIRSSEEVTQTYIPKKEGKFTIKEFVVNVNGKPIKVPLTVIIVGAAKQAQQQTGRFDPFAYDPFEDQSSSNAATQAFKEVKEDAFLGLTTNKGKVYVGEGVNVVLAFYVAETNRAEIQFYEIGNQLEAILPKIKPANCWEENFRIEEIRPRQVLINNKRYTEYKVYEATYFPLNTSSLTFPSVGLKMLKYKEVLDDNPFGNSLQPDFKTFYTKEKQVIVVELPPHPLKDQVPVGYFTLEEEISRNNGVTGQNLDYNFKIKGEGNISSLKAPSILESTRYEVFTPNTTQKIERANGRVTGIKQFSYHILPKSPGVLKLDSVFQMVFFNTSTQRYDTLKPKIMVPISGSQISTPKTIIDGNGIAQLIDKSSNTLVALDRFQTFRFWCNIIIGVIAFVGFIFILKGR